MAACDTEDAMTIMIRVTKVSGGYQIECPADMKSDTRPVDSLAVASTPRQAGLRAGKMIEQALTKEKE